MFYCCICHDNEQTEWSAITKCGHVFHTTCLAKSLNYRHRCPSCREECKARGSTAPYHRIYFQLEDNDEKDCTEDPRTYVADPNADTETPLDNTAPSWATSAQLLKRQLMLQQHHTQQLSADLKEAEEQLDLSKSELQILRTTLQSKEQKLASAIKELNETKQEAKRAQNKAANLKVNLDKEVARTSSLKILLERQLEGSALSREISAWTSALGLEAPPLQFQAMLELRNKEISIANNRAASLAKEAHQAEFELKEKIATLQQELRLALEGRMPVMKSEAVSKRPATTLNNFETEDHDDDPTFFLDDILHGRPPKQRKAAKEREYAQAQQAVSQRGEEDVVELFSEEEDLEDENVPPPSVLLRNTAAFSLVSAGPSRLGMKAAPGPTFIRDRERASIGFQDGGTFIQKGPDGRGGTATVYKGKATTHSTTTSTIHNNSSKFRRGGVVASNVAGPLRIQHYFIKE